MIRDGFVRIQKRYGREAEEAGKDRDVYKRQEQYQELIAVYKAKIEEMLR